MTQRIILLQGLAATPPQLTRLLTETDNPDTSVSPLLQEWIRRERLLLQMLHRRQIAPPPPAKKNKTEATSMDSARHFAELRHHALSALKGITAAAWEQICNHPPLGKAPLHRHVQKHLETDSFNLNLVMESIYDHEQSRSRSQTKRNS